jgi:outer membrane receptor protein involved in Fe transport
VIGTYERVIAGDVKLTLSPAWGRDTLSIAGAQAEAAGPFTSIDVVNDNLSYRMRLRGRLDDHFTLDGGLDMLSRVTSYQALVPIDDTLVNSSGVDIPPSQVLRGSQLIGLGGHVDLGIDVTSRLKLVPSLRIDGYLLDGETRQSIDPRLVARYKLRPDLTLKAYVGQFSQPPQPEGLDRRFGNPNLSIEHAIHTGLGYEWRPDPLWSIDSEIYYIDRYDLAVFTDDVIQNPDGTFSNVNFRSEGVSNSAGLELMVKREISEHAYGWLSYTFSRSMQRNHPEDDFVNTAFDQPHVLNAVASWKPGHGWELGARYQLASGRPDTPVIGATYNADSGNYVPIRGPTRSIRTPLFTQIDVRAEHDWLFERWSLGLYLDIINVTNRKNVEAIQYDYRFRSSSPVTSFPILPTLGLKGTW